jgi:hypothetical protein
MKHVYSLMLIATIPFFELASCNREKPTAMNDLFCVSDQFRFTVPSKDTHGLEVDSARVLYVANPAQKSTASSGSSIIKLTYTGSSGSDTSIGQQPYYQKWQTGVTVQVGITVHFSVTFSLASAPPSGTASMSVLYYHNGALVEGTYDQTLTCQ